MAKPNFDGSRIGQVHIDLSDGTTWIWLGAENGGWAPELPAVGRQELRSVRREDRV